MRCV